MMNSNKPRIYIIALLVLVTSTVTLKAQQDPQYTQYLYNTMSINPAYAGSLPALDIVGTYRDQWTGVDGAPTTQNLGIHSPLADERIGLGLNIDHDEIGPADEFLANANFSYKLQLSPTLKLGLGLKAGINLFNVDFSKGSFEDPDPILNMNVENRATLTLGAGGYLYTDRWYLGLSVPDFFTDEFYDVENMSLAEESLQYYLIGGYVFNLSYDFRFKPAFMMKYLEGFPLVVDVSANFLYRDKITFGASYRYDDSISALAGFQVFQSVFVGYSFDYTTTEFTNYNNGTHEIVLRFTLQPKNKSINSPRFF